VVYLSLTVSCSHCGVECGRGKERLREGKTNVEEEKRDRRLGVGGKEIKGRKSVKEEKG